MRRFVEEKLAFSALLVAAAVSSGCLTTSSFEVLWFESRPMVRRYEEMRARTQEAKRLGGSIEKGGCPVCAW